MSLGRKPRIGLMGEFSAGKSTLSNLLLGAQILPQQVTATRLPPVWLQHGSGGPVQVGLDGRSAPITLDDLDQIDVPQTRCLHIYRDAEILRLCDLIDFPGISDPNMAADIWQRMVPEVDGIIWCSHATQAWRQSEAAVWDTMPEKLQRSSMLLLTRADKLLTDRDKARVLARVQRETVGKFSAVFAISLTRAIAAMDNSAAFDASGAGPALTHLVALIKTLAQGNQSSTKIAIAPASAPIVPRRVQRIV